MFATKGWSVDASTLKPQTEIFKASKSKEDGSEKRSKKRKRKHDTEAKQDPNIRADDVGRLWEQHVEGGDLSKSQKQRERKKQKLEKPKEESEKPAAGSKVQAEVEGQEERWQDIVLGTRSQKLGIVKESKKQKEKRERREQREREGQTTSRSEKTETEEDGAIVAASTQAGPLPAPEKLTPLQAAMRQKLISSRFRYLNQTLYTEPSTAAQKLFDQDPAMFDDYHAGFRQQVALWPENPVNKFVSEIRRRANLKPPKAPKRRKANASVRTLPADAFYQLLPRTDGTTTIVDMGCGDARLAQTLTKTDEHIKWRLKFHSYDLHSPSEWVTKADIAHIPHKEMTVDIAVLCLALMGTNWISFIEEAHRILRWKGELWIAEIKSRFGRIDKSKSSQPVAHSVGNRKKAAAILKARETKQQEATEATEQDVLATVVDGVETEKQETDVSAFVAVMRRRGFILKPPGERAVDLKNKMFVKMEFVKALTPTKGSGVPKEEPKPTGLKMVPKSKAAAAVEEEEPSTEDEGTVLKPCLYKIR